MKWLKDWMRSILLFTTTGLSLLACGNAEPPGPATLLYGVDE